MDCVEFVNVLPSMSIWLRGRGVRCVHSVRRVARCVATQAVVRSIVVRPAILRWQFVASVLGPQRGARSRHADRLWSWHAICSGFMREAAECGEDHERFDEDKIPGCRSGGRRGSDDRKPSRNRTTWIHASWRLCGGRQSRALRRAVTVTASRPGARGHARRIRTWAPGLDEAKPRRQVRWRGSRPPSLLPPRRGSLSADFQ